MQIEQALFDLLQDKKFTSQLNRLEKIAPFLDQVDFPNPKHYKLLNNRIKKIKKIAEILNQ